VIWRRSVILETEHTDLARTEQPIELVFGGATPAGHLLRRFLEVFEQ
jgi:hypothetical protein